MLEVLARLKAALADRYAIDRELGHGGMATVYLAQDLKHGRSVAIKVLRPELAAALGAERFLREIEIAARLTHPHILPLHDSGEAKGFLYYVMPYVEGESLRDRLKREPQLPVEEAVRIAREVAAALTMPTPTMWYTGTSSQRTSWYRAGRRSSRISGSPARSWRRAR